MKPSRDYEAMQRRLAADKARIAAHAAQRQDFDDRASKVGRITVAVRRLQPGDLLLGSRRVVEAVYSDPFNSKIRMVKLEGEPYLRHWNANTTITVGRKDVTHGSL